VLAFALLASSAAQNSPAKLPQSPSASAHDAVLDFMDTGGKTGANKQSVVDIDQPGTLDAIDTAFATSADVLV